MKIRTDFVTNSSSSSFVAYKIENTSLAENIRKFTESDLGESVVKYEDKDYIRFRFLRRGPFELYVYSDYVEMILEVNAVMNWKRKFSFGTTNFDEILEQLSSFFFNDKDVEKFVVGDVVVRKTYEYDAETDGDPQNYKPHSNEYIYTFIP